MRPVKTWERILDGRRDVRFRDFEQLLVSFGFEFDRQSGSHKIYRHGELRVRMNIQSERGRAKVYQIRQLLEIVERHGLRLPE